MHAEHLSYQTDKGRELQEMTKLLRALGATEEQLLGTIMAYCKGVVRVRVLVTQRQDPTKFIHQLENLLSSLEQNETASNTP